MERYCSCSERDISERIKRDIPLTRKQERARKMRAKSPRTSEGYQLRNGVEVEWIYTDIGGAGFFKRK